jgi:cobalt-precorrin-5B (C1)-methyltransferase
MELSHKNVDGKLLRRGFTTGSAAAACAKAAVEMLLSGERVSRVSLVTPGQVLLEIELACSHVERGCACCGIRKDAGDDPDITNGILICAQVKRRPDGIHIEGGEGIGRVTKPGLDQPVGEAAINSTPRKMIAQAVESVCARYGYEGGISVLICAAGGEKLAKRTFNPRLGIEGGISIIGTTGIVEPMSHAALIDTIRLELSQLAALGSKNILFTPGNYAENFAQKKLGLSMNEHVSCSNFIGDSIAAAAELGFGRILLIGHIGKLVKLGIGIMNTHSSNGDGRMETLTACALEAGAPIELLRGIAAGVVADAALVLLDDAGLLDKTMKILGARIDANLKRRLPEGVEIGWICFSNAAGLEGVLAQSQNAKDLMDIWRQNT